MADTRVKTIGTSPGAGSPIWTPQKAMLDGTAFTADWLARMALEGRMYTVNAGTGTAPITFAALYTATAPDLDMSVPSGVAIVPVEIHINVEAFGTTLLFEAIAAYGKGGVIAPTSATAQTPVNHRLDKGNDSGVTIVSDGTGATYMTPATSVIEFARWNQDKVVTIATAVDTSPRQIGSLDWSALNTGVWPIMYATDGITRLNIFVSGQAATGFITMTFVKLPLTTSE